MAWADETTLLDAESISDTPEEFCTGTTLNPGEQAHIQIKVVRGGTTDDLDVKVYTQVDDTNYDTIPIFAFTYDVTAGGATGYASILLSGIYGFKIGFASTGSTDDHTVSVYCKKDGVSL